jgi:hypothetical protein
MDFELDKTYSYSKLEKWVEDDDELTLSEWGEELIGENFLVIKNDFSDEVISFVLIGVSGEYIYKVVYMD